MQVGHAFERDGLGPMRGRATAAGGVWLPASCASDRRDASTASKPRIGVRFMMEPDG